jgi:hypothetical protein
MVGKFRLSGWRIEVVNHAMPVFKWKAYLLKE